jgi:chromosome segregation ATPase
MSSNLKDILGTIENLEKYFDEYQQSLQKNGENIIQNLSLTWKKMQLEHEEVKKLEEKIEIQNNETTELKTKSDDLDKRLGVLKSSKSDLQAKTSELQKTIEQLRDDLKGPKLELDNLQLKLKNVDDKVVTKENDNNLLDQKKIDNENRERHLRTEYTEEKMKNLDLKLNHLKRNNYFTSFIIENSEEEISEVDILATIMSQGSCNLDELKKLLSIPPIMAVRTIKQLAVKGIINLDEDTNIITMP